MLYYCDYNTILLNYKEKEKNLMTKSNTPKKANETITTFVAPNTTDEALNMVVDSKQYQNKYLKPIGVTGKKLRELVHQAAMQALLLVYGSNQTRYDYFNDLMTTVEGNLSKTQAKQLVSWVEKYSPTRYVKVKDGFSFRKDKGDNAKAFDIQMAFENPFWDIELLTMAEAQALLSGANFISRVENLIKKGEKALEEDKVESSDRDQIIATLESLKAVAQANKAMTPSNDEADQAVAA